MEISKCDSTSDDNVKPKYSDLKWKTEELNIANVKLCKTKAVFEKLRN